MGNDDGRSLTRFAVGVVVCAVLLGAAWHHQEKTPSPAQAETPAAAGAGASDADQECTWCQQVHAVSTSGPDQVEVITVRSPSGQVAGTRQAKTMEAFLGIPYAKAERWQAARKLREPGWDGVLEANQSGNICPQMVGEGRRKELEERGQMRPISEDCLFLNIYRPARESQSAEGNGKLLPVMVWIHGGSFVTGAGSFYDGTALALGEVLVVTVNYRLGVLGFLQLSDDDSSPSLANFALSDLSEALHWLKRNVESFGGDPGRVTLFGQSAGGAMVGWLLLGNNLMPPDMVKGAILQSGTPNAAWAWRTRERARQATHAVAEELQCPGYGKQRNTCLHSKTVDEILDAQMKIAVSADKDFSSLGVLELGLAYPSIDNLIISSPPDQILATSPELGKIPVIIGATKDEMSYFLLFKQEVLRKADEEGGLPLSLWKEFVLDRLSLLVAGEHLLLLPVKYHDVLYHMTTALYEEENGTLNVAQMIVDLWTDVMFACPPLEMAHGLSQRGSQVFTYLFQWTDDRYPEWAGAPHTAELDFVFGAPMLGKAVSLYNYNKNVSFDRAALALSKTMMKLWTEFSRRNAHPDRQLAEHFSGIVEEWPPIGKDLRSRQLVFGNDGVSMAAPLHLASRCQQWKNVIRPLALLLHKEGLGPK